MPTSAAAVSTSHSSRAASNRSPAPRRRRVRPRRSVDVDVGERGRAEVGHRASWRRDPGTRAAGGRRPARSARRRWRRPARARPRRLAAGCRAIVSSRSPRRAAASVSAARPGAGTAAASSRAATWVSTTGAGARARPISSATSARSSNEAPQPPYASGTAMLNSAGLEQSAPQRGVEAGRFGRTHLVGRRRPLKRLAKEATSSRCSSLSARSTSGDCTKARGTPESP